MDVACAVKQHSPYLALRGVEGFEERRGGHPAHQPQGPGVLGYLLKLPAVMREPVAAGSRDLRGGSEYFDLVADILPKSA
jgi:hypothetical protein